MAVFAMAAFGCTLPHYIFGDDLLHSTNALYGGMNRNDATAIATSIDSQNSSKIDTYISDIKSMSHLNLCHTTNSSYTDSNGM